MPFPAPHPTRPVRRPRGVLAVLLALVVLPAVAPAPASAACPEPNPVVNENTCTSSSTWSTNYRLTNYSENVAGYATRTSFDRGESVPLKIAAATTGQRVDIDVYRIGWYGGYGGRRVGGATGVAVNNTFACNPMDTRTGLRDCGNWGVSYTIPSSVVTVSGVYVAKVTTTSGGLQNHIVFTVRDDARTTPAQLLFVLPYASYQAYNTWGGKSLYFDKLGGVTTISGSQRAVKVSFNRPLDNADTERNRLFGPDAQLVRWLERMGYDVSYSDDLQVHRDRAELLRHQAIVISGHAEYWSGEQMANLKAARDAGIDIASFSSNTGYWKVRYEDDGRTLVCYKTVQGAGVNQSGAQGTNDEGPDGQKGTADDALGADQVAGTADDRPENATTTFRDNGAPNGDPNAPPGGRVGPDQPENSLLGNMYVGDHESKSFALRIPAANTSGEFSGDRMWRNTGISTTSATTIAGTMVGWEWDQIPSQAQYLAKQPAGVKRVTETTTSDANSNWIQDEGRVYAHTPPSGQPANVSAVKYRASSGAWVFSAGTNQWADGFGDRRIDQATYNLLSDMGARPGTPVSGVVLDPPSGNQAPVASFTVSPSTAKPGQQVTFDATASSDADGTLVLFEWDLDGNGTYETSTGTSRTVTRTYTAEGTIDVRLRVTDNLGATGTTSRSLAIVANVAPTAAISATPNPATVGETVTFDASGSSDADGTITRVEWDLDGNGSFETDTGTARTTTRSYTAAASFTAAVRVTDDGGRTATATVPVTIAAAGASTYAEAVLGTPGLLRYWRMGEAAGPSMADSTGGSSATATNATFGVPGGPPGDPNTAVRFNGTTSWAQAAVDLSGTSRVTIEFWLKWNGYGNDDRLAFELTPNFNSTPGGFLVDPDAPQLGGTFGVGLGRGNSRNNAFFARPSAGVWHHYALVLDTTAPGASQITPYVDGAAVPYQKRDAGTGAGAFAKTTLFWMSRGGTQLFGAGDLDEVALYGRALTASEVRQHALAGGTNRLPVADFSMTPNPARPGQTVTFDGSASSDPDGTVRRYEWDLDGNGTYETDGGSAPTTSRSYPAAQTVTVGLRVTDDAGGQATRTRSLVIGTAPPEASFTATPNPVTVGQEVTFDASASTDSDGTIARYEWDLDGNGSYETDTGTTRTARRSYASAGTVTVRLRVTDDEGATGTTTRDLVVTSPPGTQQTYAELVAGTAGLIHWWRLGDAGPTLTDSKGSSPATLTGGTTGVAGAPPGATNPAVRFDGADDSARADVDLSATSVVTIEFWLKWNAFADDDDLALEHTPNFNAYTGGFIVDPNASGGSFAVSLGVDASRNIVAFDRPSAGVWHHYAFVLDTGAPAATQIVPYVDGRAVPYTKPRSGTGAGRFANSSLYLMSRGGAGLFGAGDLDEVALYDRALSAETIAAHAAAPGA